MNNVPSLSVSECLNQLELIYSRLIENKLSFGMVLAPFLWGPPGIGKSTIVYTLGEHLSTKYHKQINILDLRLYEYNPIDLKGIPYADDSHEFTQWLRPKILDFNPDENYINILFLDELLAARESVQAVGLQIVLDRKVDQYKIPDNTIIIAASNRKEDRSFSNNMSMALANRFSHYEVSAEASSWRQYAYDHNIDSRINAFIAFNPAYLVEDLSKAGYAYCSPRSWEKVSNLITLFDDLSLIRPSIASYIGEGVATEFLAFTKHTENLSNFEEIIKGKGKVPKKLDCLFAMITMISAQLRNHSLSDHELDNVFNYISQLPEDYILTFMVDNQSYFETMNLRLISLSNYKKITQKIGRFM